MATKGLKTRRSANDNEWLQVVLADTDALLCDHAHCEKKAATTALTLIHQYPQHASLVSAMTELALEELEHFGEVHEQILARGKTLGKDGGDPYAKALVDHVRRPPDERLVDRLLVSGLIEARSHARLVLLAKHHPDPDLAQMFGDFAKAEARHGHTFLHLAIELSGDQAGVEARLAELEAIERRLIDEGPIRCAMH